MEMLPDVPYRCPRCGGTRTFNTLAELKSHIAEEHAYNSQRRQRLRIFDYTPLHSFLGTGRHSPLLQSFFDEGQRLEEEVKAAKQEELNNKLRRQKQALPQLPTTRTSSLASRSTPKSGATPRKLKVNFRSPPPSQEVDPYLQETFSHLNQEVLVQRHQHWRTADALYSTQDVLSGVEEAAEGRVSEQKNFILELTRQLAEKERQLLELRRELEAVKDRDKEKGQGESDNRGEGNSISSGDTDSAIRKRQVIEDELLKKKMELENLNRQLSSAKEDNRKKLQQRLNGRKQGASPEKNRASVDLERKKRAPKESEAADASSQNSDEGSDCSSTQVSVATVSRTSSSSTKERSNHIKQLKQNRTGKKSPDSHPPLPQQHHHHIHNKLRQDQDHQRPVLTERLRSQKLKEERKVLIGQMKDLLSKATTDNVKLKDRLMAKENQLQFLNQELERSKTDQTELMEETYDLYKEAEKSLGDLKERLKAKESLLEQANSRLEEIRHAQEKLVAEKEKVARHADDKDLLYQNMMRDRDEQIQTLNDLLLSQQEERERLRKMAEELKKEMEDKERSQQQLSQAIVDKEQELIKAREDVEALSKFLQTAAAKESVARFKLEAFVTELIDRADRAEKELIRLRGLDSSSSGNLTSDPSLGLALPPGGLMDMNATPGTAPLHSIPAAPQQSRCGRSSNIDAEQILQANLEPWYNNLGLGNIPVTPGPSQGSHNPLASAGIAATGALLTPQQPLPEAGHSPLQGQPLVPQLGQTLPDQPIQQFSAHQPGQQMSAQQPGQQLSSQQHGQQMSAQQHGQQMSAQQHGQQLSSQQPGQQMSSQQPGQQISSQQPGQQMSSQQPGQQMSSQQPGQQMSSQQCGQPLPSLWHGQLLASPRHGQLLASHQQLQQFPPQQQAEQLPSQQLIQQPVSSQPAQPLPPAHTKHHQCPLLPGSSGTGYNNDPRVDMYTIPPAQPLPLSESSEDFIALPGAHSTPSHVSSSWYGNSENSQPLFHHPHPPTGHRGAGDSSSLVRKRNSGRVNAHPENPLCSTLAVVSRQSPAYDGGDEQVCSDSAEGIMPDSHQTESVNFVVNSSGKVLANGRSRSVPCSPLLKKRNNMQMPVPPYMSEVRSGVADKYSKDVGDGPKSDSRRQLSSKSISAGKTYPIYSVTGEEARELPTEDMSDSTYSHQDTPHFNKAVMDRRPRVKGKVKPSNAQPNNMYPRRLYRYGDDSSTDGLELSVDENGIMWEAAEFSETSESYRISPYGSETAGDVDTSVLLSSHSPSNKRVVNGGQDTDEDLDSLDDDGILRPSRGGRGGIDSKKTSQEISTSQLPLGERVSRILKTLRRDEDSESLDLLIKLNNDYTDRDKPAARNATSVYGTERRVSRPKTESPLERALAVQNRVKSLTFPRTGKKSVTISDTSSSDLMPKPPPPHKNGKRFECNARPLRTTDPGLPRPGAATQEASLMPEPFEDFSSSSYASFPATPFPCGQAAKDTPPAPSGAVSPTVQGQSAGQKAAAAEPWNPQSNVTNDKKRTAADGTFSRNGHPPAAAAGHPSNSPASGKAGEPLSWEKEAKVGAQRSAHAGDEGGNLNQPPRNNGSAPGNGSKLEQRATGDDGKSLYKSARNNGSAPGNGSKLEQRDAGDAGRNLNHTPQNNGSAPGNDSRLEQRHSGADGRNLNQSPMNNGSAPGNGSKLEHARGAGDAKGNLIHSTGNKGSAPGNGSGLGHTGNGDDGRNVSPSSKSNGSVPGSHSKLEQQSAGDYKRNLDGSSENGANVVGNRSGLERHQNGQQHRGEELTVSSVAAPKDGQMSQLEMSTVRRQPSTSNSPLMRQASVVSTDGSDAKKLMTPSQKPAKQLRAMYSRSRSNSSMQSSEAESVSMSPPLPLPPPLPLRDTEDNESTDFDFESDLEKFTGPGSGGGGGRKGVVAGKVGNGRAVHKRLKMRKMGAGKQGGHLSVPSALDDSGSNVSDAEITNKSKRREEAHRRRVALFCVFSYLDTRSLIKVSQVCKEWRRVSRHPALWKHVHLKYERISSQFLVTLATWCTQLTSLTLEGLRAGSRHTGETMDQYHRRTRGCLEPGLEELLKASQDTLTSLSIVACGNILTDKCMWLVSGYCRLMQRLTYLSDTHPLNAEVMWALGGGCPSIISLIIPPLFPCHSSEGMNNRCLMLIAQFYPDLLEIGVGGRSLDITGLVPLVQSCQRLQYLGLDHIKELGEDSATALSRTGLRQLQRLELSGTPITSNTLKTFYNSCRHLKEIRVSICISDCFEDVRKKKNKEEYKQLVRSLEELKSQPGLGNILQLKAAPVQ